jgi:nucleoside-diphosphate-sugar epimerase
MNVLLTGANGFVGSHILDELRETGLEVSILLRRTSATRFIERHVNDGITVHYGSLDDTAALAHAMEDAEAVVHCAGKTKALGEHEYNDVNKVGTQNIVRAAAQNGKLRHFVFVSSLAVSGPGTPTQPARETDPPNPVTVYGKSKLAGEEAVTSQCPAPWTILRPAAVYGPRDRDFLPLFRAARRGIVPLPGGGRQVLSFVYGRDVAAAVNRCLGREEAFGKIYNIAAEPPCAATEFAQTLARAMGTRARTVSIPGPVLYIACVGQEWMSRWRRRTHALSRQKWAELRAPGWVCATDRIRQDLGFTAPTPLADGVTRTAAWYKRQGWL